MLPGFEKLNLSDQQIQRFHDNVARGFAPLIGETGLAILSGRFVTATLAVGVNKISHKLGRSPQGWTVTDINAAATVYRSATFDAFTLQLTSSAICTITLWVF